MYVKLHYLLVTDLSEKLVHAWLAVSTTQQREEWNHYTRGSVATEKEDTDSDVKYSVIPLLIYP